MSSTITNGIKGWDYTQSSEQDGERQTRTRRRADKKSSVSDEIVLRRQLDQLEVKTGSTILVSSGDSTSIAIIKEIRFGINQFIEVFVIWFCTKDEVEQIPQDVDVVNNEIFLTPYLDEIQLGNIINKVTVLPVKDFEGIVIDESTKDTTFMCRRATNEKEKITEPFDFGDMMQNFHKNADQFVDVVKKMLFNRKKLQKQQQKQQQQQQEEEKVLDEMGNKKGGAIRKQKRKHEKIESNDDAVDTPQLEEIEESDLNSLESAVVESSSSSEEEVKLDESDASDFERESSSTLKSKTKSRTEGTRGSGRGGGRGNSRGGGRGGGRGSSRGGGPALINRKSPLKKAKTIIPAPDLEAETHSEQTPIDEIYSIVTPKKKMRIIANQSPLPSFTSPTKKGLLLDPKSEAFHQLKQKLHTSHRLDALPGREDEFMAIWANLESAINEGSGCCVYVSGVPGMGKTATIKEIIRQMTEVADMGEMRKFSFLEINGLKLLSSTAAYGMLWQHISGDRVTDSNAAVLLEEYFKNDKPKEPLVVLMDELDQVAQKQQNVMYNFFNWPTYSTSSLIVIAVANTMDLPERMLSNKISSRMGLRRIQFKGYSFHQLGDIIRHRLSSLVKHSKYKVTIVDDAIGFAARKVAGVSGDARRALNICKRAVEIAEQEFSKQELDNYAVTTQHISMAIVESVKSPLAQYIKSLPFGAKLVLAALLKRMRRSGFAEIPLGDIIEEMKNMMVMTTSNPFETDTTMHDILYAKESLSRIYNFDYVLASLVDAGLISQQNAASERKRLLMLSVSEEEVVSAMKRDNEISQYL